jgi:DNA-binding NtrC family response regulator
MSGEEESYERKRVLIVEDNEDVANSLKRIVEIAAEYTPETFVGNKEAILDNIEHKVRKFQPDATIVDGLDGGCFEVVDKIEKTRPGIICVIYSGNSCFIREHMPEGKEYKIFKKPIHMQEMLEYIDLKLKP